MYSKYPGSADLAAFLSGTGLPIPAGINLQAKCDAAISEWETRTGWHPYLSADTIANPSTRLFDPPAPPSAYGRMASFRGGRYLNLQAGLLSLTSLSIGVVPNSVGVYDGSSGTQGTPLVENLYFYLRPLNAIARSYAYTDIEFIFPVSGIPQSISIVGVWGRETALTGDVWQAILQKAAALSGGELSLAISGGLMQSKIADWTETFGGTHSPGPLFQEIINWNTQFDALVRNKKRISC